MLLCLSGGAAAETYLCVGQLSTGFEWRDGRWHTGALEVQDKVFVVQPSADRAREYAVTRMGDHEPSHYCPSLARRDASMLLTCGGLGNGFTFSSKTLRFQENYGIGYTSGGDSNANAPHLTIGKCAELELRGSVD
ncbi:hypothetical protein [Mesorhizobium xinjiangense]|uniref:hypothetical protein n=1 Tax=Mesorhizobium xinjiangense TaxID=2678685 RepID=UPI0012EE8623|nr:hypothetical protein [Mesorhizobium xinjiangense]